MLHCHCTPASHELMAALQHMRSGGSLFRSIAHNNQSASLHWPHLSQLLIAAPYATAWGSCLCSKPHNTSNAFSQHMAFCVAPTVVPHTTLLAMAPPSYIENKRHEACCHYPAVSAALTATEITNKSR
eukprot:gnl/MRDRNA2_/MRDRNA2_38447_c0_seq2.p1 gnl/MRDRNA2_/MRDRNA2_38447_c0~~gnl/MRDRNA2_/MRDRNA2_38447_c0_seq2.p1  ORF type:complete len:128 (+),score=8.97 gnl/MRDRNA2_/MRDRNA2_38447_c0_seq2:200-583(+)